MAIIDTNRRTTSHLKCLKKAGVDTIIRYYARFRAQPQKRLTLEEAEAILASGIKIAVVCQSSGDNASYFTKKMGMQDGVYARNYGASVIGQPDGSAIYFSVDYDAPQDEIDDNIVPYFESIAESFEPSVNLPEYSIGCYGNGAVCKTLLDAGLVKYTWLSQSTGHLGHKAFKKSGRWTLFQNLPSDLCSIGVDVDELNSNTSDFGSFAELIDASTLVSQETKPVSAASFLATDTDDFATWFISQGFRHFKPYELLVMGGRHGNPGSPCFGKNTHPPREKWNNIVETLRVLDLLRDRLDAPIRITSAYRNKPYNTCIGGAGESMHVEFKALDFIGEGGSRPVDWARTLRSMRDDEGIFSGGVGLYPGFVHVDCGTTRDW